MNEEINEWVLKIGLVLLGFFLALIGFLVQQVYLRYRNKKNKLDYLWGQLVRECDELHHSVEEVKTARRALLLEEQVSIVQVLFSESVTKAAERLIELDPRRSYDYGVYSWRRELVRDGLRRLNHFVESGLFHVQSDEEKVARLESALRYQFKELEEQIIKLGEQSIRVLKVIRIARWGGSNSDEFDRAKRGVERAKKIVHGKFERRE